MRISAFIVLLAVACLLASGGTVFANDPPQQTGKRDSTVSPLLQQFIQERESGASLQGSDTTIRSQSDAGVTTKDAQVTTDDGSSDSSEDPVRFDSSGNVQVYIHLENTDDATLQQLRGLGADVEITNSDVNVVQAWVPTTALDDIAALDAVEEITPPDYGQTKAGRVNTEGDGIHRAGLVRTFSGLTGKGVRVGVISDGVDSASSARASRDLPSKLEINPFYRGSGDEGTALLEIIHDLAPDAELAFSGGNSSLRFVEAVLWLANDAFDGEGADIIVDDLGHYLEPYYEDGVVAQAVADAVAGGAVYVSSAGNNANKHYTGTFSDDGNGYHDFDDSGATDIALRVRPRSWIVLKWNDQFGASANDYDLFVCLPGLKPVKFNLQNSACRGSTRLQNGDDDPYERITSFFSFSRVVEVYIRKYSGSARELKLFVNGGAVLEHGVEEGGIIGHPAVTGALAVGAIDAADPGNDEAQHFSDRGPTEIYFPSRETRNKPDVMGIDGVLVTGSGGFGRPAPGVTGNLFLGTSAAAPHVAGIAALVIEAQRKADPTMTKKTVADAVTQKLKDTAIDLGETGRDNTFGYGRADAFAAIESLAGASATDALNLYSMSSYTDTHTINSTGDGADDDTTDGVCDDGTVDGSTNCTLRSAIQQTNAGSGATIEFNISASGVQTISPTSSLPAITKPVFIDGYSQSGASAGTVLIELDGTNAGSGTNGLTLSGEGSVVRGLAINSFGGNGIVLQGRKGGQVLVGNYIGTDDTGAIDEGNGAAGVYINGAPNVVLRDSVISGNATYGVHVNGSGASGAVLTGNKIGTNAAGTDDLGNTTAGVHVNSARDVALRDNVISGNDTHGVSLAGNARGSTIEYNKIGTDEAGSADLGNTGSGIHISGSRESEIYENTIGFNDSHGIGLTGSGTYDAIIAENYIGTNASENDLGNEGSGVHISGGARDNTVEDNTIAYNGGDGVTITGNSSTGNTVWENSIHSNDGHGIDLGDDGLTANDTGDDDSGPNHLQNYPSNITFATRGDVASVRFSLYATEAKRPYIVDFYSCDSSTSGEGEEWLGFIRGIPSAVGTRTFTASTLLGQINDYTTPTATDITAAATDSETGSTSEFAPCVARVDLPELVISETEIEAQEGGNSTYTVALSALPSAETKVFMYVDDIGVALATTANLDPTNVLTFTTTNGTTAQTVTVTGVSDDDGDNEATTIRHMVVINDNEYLTAVLPVEVTDDEAPKLTLGEHRDHSHLPQRRFRGALL